jgi:hypothetical protein
MDRLVKLREMTGRTQTLRGRGKDDRKKNILAPLIHMVKFPRYCVGETVPPLLVNNRSLFVFVSVSLSLVSHVFSFSDDPVITLLVPPSLSR